MTMCSRWTICKGSKALDHGHHHTIYCGLVKGINTINSVQTKLWNALAEQAHAPLWRRWQTHGAF